MLSFFRFICKDILLTRRKFFPKRILKQITTPIRRQVSLRIFNIVCPFCEYAYPIPDSLEMIHKCDCGAVYKIALRPFMEDAVDQLVQFFLRDEDSSEGELAHDFLGHVVICEDIQDLIRMKREYEAVKYIRPIQSFKQSSVQNVGLVWLGSYRHTFSHAERLQP